MDTVLYVVGGLVVVWILLEVTGLSDIIWGIRTYRDGLKDRERRKRGD